MNPDTFKMPQGMEQVPDTLSGKLNGFKKERIKKEARFNKPHLPQKEPRMVTSLAESIFKG